MAGKRSLFIGRWQPFHAGHKSLIDKVLAEGQGCAYRSANNAHSRHCRDRGRPGSWVCYSGDPHFLAFASKPVGSKTRNQLRFSKVLHPRTYGEA